MVQRREMLSLLTRPYRLERSRSVADSLQALAPQQHHLWQEGVDNCTFLPGRCAALEDVVVDF